MRKPYKRKPKQEADSSTSTKSFEQLLHLLHVALKTRAYRGTSVMLYYSGVPAEDGLLFGRVYVRLGTLTLGVYALFLNPATGETVAQMAGVEFTATSPGAMLDYLKTKGYKHIFLGGREV